MSNDDWTFPHTSGYFVDPTRVTSPYIEPWEDQLKSCIVICLDRVEFHANDRAWGYVCNETVTTDFWMEWNWAKLQYLYRKGEGFLTRWDTGEYMLIIPIKTDDTFEDG